MSEYDLIVRRGTLVRADGVGTGDIAVADGEIVEVAGEIAGGAREEIDANGLHVFPGGVDIHVHFDDPGRAHWEGFETGTAALAAGGVTTYCDMPLNNTPATLDAVTFRAKLAVAERTSLVDFGLWAGLVPGNVGRLDELAECGAVGFKAFMTFTGIEDFEAADDLTLYEGMEKCAELGRLVAVHAENDGIIGGLSARARAAGKKTLRDFMEARPSITEVEAIGRAVLFAEDTRCPLHVVHVSSPWGVRLVREAQARLVDVTCETCTHYLVFCDEEVWGRGIVAKCAPPIRTRDEREGLWEAVADGSLSMVTSDHSPSSPDMKQGDDLFAMFGGMSGCQTTLPVLLAAAAPRSIDESVISALTATNPARRLGLDKKGELAAGFDADLALVDLKHEGIVTAEELRYRWPVSAFVGCPTRGRVVRTLVRGRTVFAYGEIMSEPVGRLVVPADAPITSLRG
jgi:allantoinase